MPTYSYKCFDCGAEFEAEQRISEEPLKECQSCKSVNVKRLISATAFHLKGGGWYKTDYASSASANGKAKNDVKPADSTTSSSSTDVNSNATKSESNKTAETATKPATSDKN